MQNRSDDEGEHGLPLEELAQRVANGTARPEDFAQPPLPDPDVEDLDALARRISGGA